MLSSLRSLFASEPPRLRSAAVQEWLQRQVQLFTEGVQRLAARQMIDDAMRTAKQKGLTDPNAVFQLLAEARASGDSISLPYTAVRMSVTLAEFALAVADRLNEQDADAVADTLATLLTIALHRPCDANLARTILSVHGETVAAVLPGGWKTALIDVPQFRDEGHGVLIGNAMAAQLIDGGWGKRATLKKEIADLIVARMTDPAPDAPLPAERPFLARRHPERWQALAESLGADIKRASVQGRPEATEALLGALIDAALGDRLQDQILNGEQPGEQSVEVPPVLGLAIIDMAAFAKGHRNELQPVAEVEAARLLHSVLGLDGNAAAAAAQRLAAFRRAVVGSYEGIETPGMPKGEGLAVLSYAQTRGRKIGQFVQSNVDATDPAALPLPENEVRAMARLFRFAAAFQAALPDLPSLGSRPAPDRAAAEQALVERFRAAGLNDAFIERWRADEDVRGRLGRLFASLDRLFPHPEYVGAEELPMLAEHFGVDLAGGLERSAVSVALDEHDTLLFLAVLSLRLFEDLALTPGEEAALLRLVAERAQPSLKGLLKIMPRNVWLANRTLLPVEPLDLARLALRDGLASERQPAHRLVALGNALARSLRQPSGASTTEVEQEAQAVLLVTPASLRKSSRS